MLGQQREEPVAVPNHYTSFLLRLRWTQTGSRPTWVICLQNTNTSEPRWFPNLDALVAFLRTEFREDAGATAADQREP